MTLFNLALAALVSAQPAPPATAPQDDQTDTAEVAFDQLSEGRAAEAVSELEDALRENPDDPALLINLGAAYIGMGEYQSAQDAYRRAIDSDTRYKLELADGSWVDSRFAARRALEQLEGRGLAMR